MAGRLPCKGVRVACMMVRPVNETSLRQCRQRSTLGRVDDSLRFVASGSVWSPIHWDTAFTVPLFHKYLLRKVPANP